MDFQFTPVHEEIFRRAHEFASTQVAPLRDQLPHDVEARKRLYRRLANEGLYLPAIPKEYGGTRTDFISFLLIMWAISKVDPGFSVVISLTNMVGGVILRHGTEEQIARYVGGLGRGEVLTCAFALTEEGAGSDPSNMLSTAREDGDQFVISGNKRYITNGDVADLFIVFAKLQDKVTAFLVEKGTPGLSISRVENKIGLMSVNLAALKLDEVRVPKSHLLGGVGDGLKIALGGLDGGRIGVAAQCIGIAEAAYEGALKHATTRQQFGKPIIYNQGVSFKIADMETKLSAAKLLMLRAGWLRDQGKAYTKEASMAKLYASEMVNELTATAFQVYGGLGYLKDCDIERHMRDCRVTTIYEGTSEIQRIVISRHAMKAAEQVCSFPVL